MPHKLLTFLHRTVGGEGMSHGILCVDVTVVAQDIKYVKVNVVLQRFLLVFRSLALATIRVTDI